MFTENIRSKVRPFTNWLGKTFAFASPNAWTSFAFAVGVMAAYFLVVRQFGVAAVLILISGILDVVDGAVARVTKRQTIFGGIYDSFVDKITEGLIYLALSSVNALTLPALTSFFLFSIASYTFERVRAEKISLGQAPWFVFERKERIGLLFVGIVAGNTELLVIILSLIALSMLYSVLLMLRQVYSKSKALK